MWTTSSRLSSLPHVSQSPGQGDLMEHFPSEESCDIEKLCISFNSLGVRFVYFILKKVITENLF